MKVLVIASPFHPPWGTGYVSYVRGLVKSLVKLEGVEVCLLSILRRRAYLLDTIEHRVLSEYFRDFLEMLKSISKVIYFEEQVKNKHSDRYVLTKSVVKLLNEEHIDYVHDIVGLERVWLSSMGRRAHVFRYITNPAFKLHEKIYGAALKFLKFRSMILTFTSREVAKTYGFNDGYIVIPPAIDTEFYKPRNVNTLDNGYDYHLLYIGPLNPERFPLQMVKALKHIKEDLKAKIKLTAISTPWRKTAELSYVKTIRELAKRLEVNYDIEILFRTLTEVEKVILMNQYDVFLYLLNPIKQSIIIPIDPPLTPLEAMACGIPVVTTPFYSMKKIIRPGITGFVANTTNVDNLSSTIISALLDRSVSRRARIILERFFSVRSVTDLLRKLHMGIVW